MAQSAEIESFIDKYEKEKLLLIDTRSENEFEHAHIPGAINIPLLKNEHRQKVGIKYKSKGREAAVALGFELVGPYFHEFIKQTGELTDRSDVLIYCWRGGMRSSIMSWILSMAGYRVTLLKGGYKSFRNFILSQFNIRRDILVLGGHTGCGKTEILNELNKCGEQVIDLENLASHRGSAFGTLGLEPQLSNEFFENQLGILWRKLDNAKPVWFEAESHTIGRIKIPDQIFNQLQNAPLIEIICSREYRKKRIMDEYGVFPKTELTECTSKLKKRLGHLRLKEALCALEEDRLNDWLDILIDYYDKTYSFSLKERSSLQRVSLKIDDDMKSADIAKKILKELSVINKKETV